MFMQWNVVVCYFFFKPGVKGEGGGDQVLLVRNGIKGRPRTNWVNNICMYRNKESGM